MLDAQANVNLLMRIEINSYKYQRVVFILFTNFKNSLNK